MANANAKLDAIADVSNVIDIAVKSLQERQATMWSKLEELADNAALASTSLYELSILFQDSVREKLIAATDNVSFYQKYFDRVKMKLAASALKAGKEGLSSNSFESQCSKLKSFGMAAAVHLGESLYETIDRVWLGLPAETRAVSMSASYSRINTRAQKLLTSKDCGGDLAKMQAIVLGKTDWLEINLTKSETKEEAAADEAADEKAESNKSPLDKLGDIAAAVTKLSKKGFEGDVQFEQFAAYVAAFHSKMVSEQHKGAVAPTV